MVENVFEKFAKCFIIAEIGVNHNGNINLAKCLIDKAVEVNASAVKFQSYQTEKLVSENTPKVAYQKKSKNSINETHFQMLKRFELSRDSHVKLYKYCEEKGIEFISTPYDVESARLLQELGVKYFKTASADITDILLHDFIASTGVPTIIATGMASPEEVEAVINIYKKYNTDVCLLHCVSNYPCSDHSLNLNVISKMKLDYGLPIGFSDHSNGNLASLLSIALGAKIIEKHFTLNRGDEGPDHAASSEPHEFADLVSNIRTAEVMLGCGIKARQPEESEMAAVSRKSICISQNMCAGDFLLEELLIVKRPGTGIGANFIHDIVGRKILRDISAGTILQWSDLE